VNVRSTVARSPKTPVKVLEKLSEDKDNWVRARVAQNTNTPVKILEKLSKDKNELVRDAVKKESERRGYTTMYMTLL
jgi:3-methyladenine DNA glycosylase AlkC